MATSVLIVDDHPSFRANARLLLESEGYTVVGEAADGTAALAEAGRLHPDVVLLDVGLPDLDGFEVSARLTRLEIAPAVVLVSSRDCVDCASFASASGARGFISKAELTGPALEALL